MFQLMSVTPKVSSGSSSPLLNLSPENAEISFDKICFEYVHGQKILHDLSFTVPAGQNFAIVGGSGSGKSTIIRLLYRFFEPSAGSITIGDQNISAVDLDSLRKEIAIVPQDSVLLHNTIKHNIAYGNLTASDDQVFRFIFSAEDLQNSQNVSELQIWRSCTAPSWTGPMGTRHRWGRGGSSCQAGRSRGWPLQGQESGKCFMDVTF